MFICKFGGTILNDSKNYTKIYRLINRRIKKEKVLIIVSAIGRINDPYSTDTLMKQTNYLNELEKDSMVSIGEQYSSLKLTNYLKQKGLKTRCILLNEINLKITGNYEVYPYFYEELFNDYDCVIVPGFLGKNEFGYIKTLPRGGSDLTAILMAKYLNEKDVYLYKDTIGVYSCNDDIIHNKETINRLSYDQANTYFSYTGEVVQTNALEIAKQENIKVHICNLNSRIETIIHNQDYPYCIYGIMNIENKIYLFGKTDEYTLTVIKDFLRTYRNIQYNVRIGFIELVVDKIFIDDILIDLHKRFIES